MVMCGHVWVDGPMIVPYSSKQQNGLVTWSEDDDEKRIASMPNIKRISQTLSQIHTRLGETKSLYYSYLKYNLKEKYKCY